MRSNWFTRAFSSPQNSLANARKVFAVVWIAFASSKSLPKSLTSRLQFVVCRLDDVLRPFERILCGGFTGDSGLDFLDQLRRNVGCRGRVLTGTSMFAIYICFLSFCRLEPAVKTDQAK